MQMSEKIISIRFLSFKGFLNKRFGFAQMGISFINPWKHSGLLFSKHLGVGAGNGFSLVLTVQFLYMLLSTYNKVMKKKMAGTLRNTSQGW